MPIELTHYPNDKTLDNLLEEREEALSEIDKWSIYKGLGSNQVRLWEAVLKGIEEQIVEKTILTQIESGPE